jgi:xanthine dehydrogenase YagT iron-sulfur-binding subunit
LGELEKGTALLRGATDTVDVELSVNGAQHRLTLEPRCTLLDALRDRLHLTGTKKSCDMGECGACTVLMDGKPVYSCLLLAIECQGHDIQTIEGLSQDGLLDPIQVAFMEYDSYQCGFCTPGQIMAVRGLLLRNPAPTPEEIRVGISGNLCRCGAYPRIFKAATAAAQAYEEARHT